MGVVPQMDVLLDEYYAAAGWERESGRPNVRTLERLGLGFAG
jgi:aldehyde:ferredoxin oxidoreductase